VISDTAMPFGQCLTDEMLTDYLDDALDPVLKGACEVHITACDACRQRLGVFMRLLRADFTPDEEAMVSAISDVWNKRKGGSPPLRERRAGSLRSLFLFLAGIAGLAVMVLMAVWIGNRPRIPRSPDEVVRLLLLNRRPFEARLSGQPYLPLDQTRSGDASSVDYKLLAGEMSRLAADPYEMGRFYLLQQEFDLAIRSLEIAAKDPGAPPEVHNDLGVAYMERGGKVNLMKALDAFHHALEMKADFAPAIFNLGLVCERAGTSADAEAQRKLYLQMDSASGWAREIRSRVQGLSQ